MSYWYYKRAGSELKYEAKRLHQQTNLILLSLEQAGLVTLKRDSCGGLTGFDEWKIRGAGLKSTGEVGEPSVQAKQVAPPTAETTLL